MHCDPTASHYIKLLMDAVFSPKRFRTEIIWKRSSAHSDTKQGRKQHGRVHDTLLFYTKGDTWTWNPQYNPYDPNYVNAFYKYIEPETGRRYRLGDLTGPGGATKGNPSYELMGVARYWRYSKENMQRLVEEGRIVQTKPGAVPAYKRCLDEMPGVPLQDLWTDIPPLSGQAAEGLGYPTQKPEALLDRIIKTSTNEADVVLDSFCGCGTAVAAAQRLNRRWIGVDITHLATNLIKSRLHDAFGNSAKYIVRGEPTTLSGAEELAMQDKYEFQNWALGLVKARKGDIKKGADGGIDGKLLFHDDASGKTKQILISVKGGNIALSMVRDLAWVVEREKAAIGVFITLKEPTKPMRMEAASAGTYYSPGWNKTYPKLQILTVKELLDGKGIAYPPAGQVNVTFKTAPQAPTQSAETLALPLDDRPAWTTPT